ncbi:ATP-binding protein [Deinococcus sp. YIM 77859]|uniref:ATP-binding protein n=1 Tax=Deinococcus sp. YIM 77859 TaxID=1540221 RepID=UPI00054EA51E|nr:ATP-binding protein [Deinococcus sp. YIM 77859]
MTTSAPLPDDLAQAAHAYLDQARANAATQTPARREPTSLDRMLGKLREQGQAAPALPTSADLARWQADPAGLTDELHVRSCAGGLIEVQVEPGRTAAVPCPRCTAARRDANLRNRLTASGIALRYLDLDWSNLDTAADPFPRLRAATGCISDVIAANDSLALIGPPGSGKTQTAVLAAKAALAAGHSALVVNLGRLALDVRESYRGGGEGTTERQALQMLIAPDLLVLDDLGAGETDTAAVERRLLYLALEDRQNARKPCIITTNLNPTELAGHLGARNLGRLQPLEIVEMRHGRNFRLQEGRKSLW